MHKEIMSESSKVLSTRTIKRRFNFGLLSKQDNGWKEETEAPPSLDLFLSYIGLLLSIMVISLYRFHFWLILWIASGSPSCSVNGLLTNPKPTFDDLLGKFGGNKVEPLTKKQQGQLLLQKLNLTATTEPKAFSVEPQNIPNILWASLPAVFRLFTGALAEGYDLDVVRRDPSQYTILPLGDANQFAETSRVRNSMKDVTTMTPIVLYDREGDALCRLVREACSILSLTVQILPCPKEGVLHPDQKQFPTLQDPNTGVELRSNKGMDDVQMILSYLFKTYGNGQVPMNFNPKLASITATIAMGSRLGLGSTYKSSNVPELPLTLWSYESSPFCKVVTEELGTLEIPYTVTYAPRGSPNRQRMLDTYGRFQVPFLVDPNTGVELWESSAICEYLEKQYAVRTSVTYL